MSTRARFTLTPVIWKPRLETVDDIDATDDQRALVNELAGSTATGRGYWATLAHDEPALRARQKLFRESLQGGEGGSPRSDRELAAVAASRVNGCAYCASVHARAHAQLTRSPDLIQSLLDEGIDTELPEHERAIVDFAAKLTRDPAGMSVDDLAPLRAVGLSDTEILDITYATAMFAWANRLMQTLGDQQLDASAS